MEQAKPKSRIRLVDRVPLTPKSSTGAPRRYGLISSKYKGQGPGKYNRQPCTGIKDHDCTMYAEPAYTMRVKTSEKLITDVVSPGPCYYVDPYLTHLGLWRPVSFRMAQERKRILISETPAPNAYYVENLHPIEEPNAPAYSLGKRTQYYEHSPYPAPNRYTLPATLGPGLPVRTSAPCPSMAPRTSWWTYTRDLVKGPGPAGHFIPEPDVYLHHQPAYSMAQRLIPSVKDYTPGPAHYNDDVVTLHKPRPPHFSMGIRHSDYVHTTPPVNIIKE